MAKCVNALSRANLISTEEFEMKKVDTSMCQCPIAGESHFYKLKEAAKKVNNRVSMPYRGRISFLRLLID